MEEKLYAFLQSLTSTLVGLRAERIIGILFFAILDSALGIFRRDFRRTFHRNQKKIVLPQTIFTRHFSHFVQIFKKYKKKFIKNGIFKYLLV